MPTEFESGAREELRLVLTAQHDTSSGTDMTVLPHTGNPTGPHKPYSRGPTDEVRKTLDVQDNPVRGFTVPFSYSGIHRYGIHDTPWQMVMGNPWSAAVLITGADIAGVDTGNKFTSSTTDKFNALSADVPCPIWILRDGASPLALPALALSVVTGSSPELAISLDTNFGIDLADVTAGDTVTIMHGGILKNGVTEYFAMVERAQTGLDHFYVGYGMFGTQMDLNQAKGSDPTITFNAIGKDAQDANTTFGTGTETAANTFRAYNTGANLMHFGVGGVFDPSNVHPSECNLSLVSAGNPIDPMGRDGPYAHSKDTVMASGRYSIFSNDAARTIQGRQVSNTDDSLFWSNRKTVAGVTNAYFYWLPLIQYGEAGQDGGGKAGSLKTPLTWNAAASPTFGNITLCVARMPAMPLS